MNPKDKGLELKTVNPADDFIPIALHKNTSKTLNSTNDKQQVRRACVLSADLTLSFKNNPLSCAAEKYLKKFPQRDWKLYASGASIHSFFSFYHSRHALANYMIRTQNDLDDVDISKPNLSKKKQEKIEVLTILARLPPNSTMFKYLCDCMTYECKSQWNNQSIGAVTTMYDNPVLRTYNQIKNHAIKELNKLTEKDCNEPSSRPDSH